MDISIEQLIDQAEKQIERLVGQIELLRQMQNSGAKITTPAPEQGDGSDDK